MQESSLDALEQLFLALSDKTRLRLVELIGSEEVSVGFLAEQLGESQPKVSRHLAYLRNANVVSTRRDGKWIYYYLRGQDDPTARRILDAVLPSELAVNEAQPFDTYAEPNITEWRPEELDVFLL